MVAMNSLSFKCNSNQCLLTSCPINTTMNKGGLPNFEGIQDGSFLLYFRQTRSLNYWPIETGASLRNSGRGVQGQIFRQKGVVVESFFRIRAWHTLQLMTRDELKVITLERCHVFLFINERNNQRQVIATI